MKCFGMPCHMQIIFQLHFVRVVCEIHLLCVNLQCVHLYSHLLSQLHVHLHLHLSRILCVCVNHQSSFFLSPEVAFAFIFQHADMDAWCSRWTQRSGALEMLEMHLPRPLCGLALIGAFWFCKLCADKKLDKYPNTLLRKQRNAHVV